MTFIRIMVSSVAWLWSCISEPSPAVSGDQRFQDNIGRKEPTIRGRRIPSPNMSMLGADSERAYSSILLLAPDIMDWFALSSALLLPSSVASQDAVTIAFREALSSLPYLAHLLPSC